MILNNIPINVTLSLVALAVMGCTTAYAQDNEESILVLEEMVVTAQRIESLLSETPVAVTAINGDDLRSAGISDPTNLESLVPNLSIDRNSQGGVQLTIRGVSSNDDTEKGDPSAAFLLDGTYLARTQAQEVSFYDLDRIEVLRGPQGTLYGRNTTAGVVNAISNRPDGEFAGSVDIAVGDFGTTQATGVLNFPISSGAAIRAAVNIDQRENYSEPPSDSPFTLNDFKDNLSARLSGSFDITENLNLLLIADHSNLEGVSQSRLPVANFYSAPFTPGAEIRQTDLSSDARRQIGQTQSSQSFRDNSSTGITAELSWNIGSGALTYLASTRDFDRVEQETVVSGLVRQNFDAEYTQSSHELRYAFSAGNAVKGQVGIYYFDEESTLQAFFNDPIGVLGIPPTSSLGFIQDPTEAKSTAGFAQLTYGVSDRLSITGGIRHTEDEKSREGTSVLDLPNGPRIPIAVNDAAVEFDETTWRFGVDYDSSYGLIYGSVSTGYKAGGFNDGCVIGTQPGCDQPEDVLFYNPETLTSVEAGFKFSLLNDRMELNAAVFSYDYEDLQLASLTFVGGAPATNISNAAQASVDGIELDSMILLNERNRIDLGLTFLNAEFDEFNPTPDVSFAGAPLARSPDSTLFAAYSYLYPLASGAKLSFKIKTKFNSGYFLNDVGAAIRFEQDSFSKTDLNATYTSSNESWYVQVYANNLEDEVTVATVSSALGGFLFADDPRTMGVRAGYKF